MPRYALLLALLLAPSCTCPLKQQTAETTPPPDPVAEAPAADAAPAPVAAPSEVPPSRREEVVDDLFGVAVADPYRWLEPTDRPEVQDWMTAQDALTRKKLDALPGRDAVGKRFAELLYIDWVSAPYHRGGRWFYMKRAARQEKAVLYWKGARGDEQVLIDPNTLSADGSTSLGEWSPSFDGRYLAYSLRRNNADSATMYVRDIDAGKDLEADVIEDAKYASPSWTPDSKGFYYTWLPRDPSIPVAELPGYAEVRWHALGSDAKADPIVREALHDPTAFLGAYVSRDGRWLMLEVQHGWTSNDVYYKDLKAKAADFRPLVVGQKALYTVVPWKGAFYVSTNDGAPRYRVLKIDPRKPDRKAWKELVPEGEAPIEAMQVVGNHLVLITMRNAANEMEVRTLDGKPVRKVPLPGGLGSTSGMVGNPDEDEAYFSFSSFTQPQQIFKTSVKSGKTSLWDAVKVPVDTSRFVAEQIFYPSKDGTRVSMFLVHAKDLARTGDHPTLLTGYGGFNVNMTPWFSAVAVVWLELGGVWAMPNLRGGGEYGEEWHRAGMRGNKQNVFDDFVAAAEWLVAEKITRPDRLAIYGASNGGLLVGAAMTQRPDLFQAVLCGVPLLDMVRYHRFGSGKTWIEEYGSADDAEQFKTLHAYSPYHHVDKGTAYPALLVLSADSDDRVDPMHARKFVAAVQWATASKAPVLLRVEKNAGHGGGDMIKKRIAQEVDSFAFVMDLMGLAPAP